MTAGGLIIKKKIANVNVSWTWYDQAKGVVQWTFSNPAGITQSGILFRDTYPFGNAFWPIYEANPSDFDVHFTSIISPLVDNGIENNTAPIVVFQNPDKSMFVAFLFTLASGQSWSILEGGFSSSLTPSEYGSPEFVPAVKLGINQFSISWDPEQCQGYNQQAGTDLPCPANPISRTSALMGLDRAVNPLFDDSVSTSGSASKPSCLEMLIQGIYKEDLIMIENAIECVFGSIPMAYKNILIKKYKKF